MARKPKKQPNLAQDPTKIAYWTARGLDIPAARGHAEAERRKRGLKPLPSGIDVNRDAKRGPKPPPLQSGLDAVFPGNDVGTKPDRLFHPPKPPTQPQADRRTRTILRRQALLQTLGLLQTAPDGIWGPKSQRAWAIYVYRKQHGRLGVPVKDPVPIERREQAQARAQEAAALRQDAQRRAEDVRKLKLEAGYTAKEAVSHMPKDQPPPKPVITQADAARLSHEQAAAERAHLVREGNQLRADPTRATKLDLHHLTRVLTNGDFKFDPTDQRDVKIVQTWLSTHGHKEVVVDGSWGRKTNDALVGAYKAQAMADKVKAYRTIERDFYGKGGLVVGSHPDWWPLDSDVPNADGLLKLLNANDFTSAVLFRALVENGGIEQRSFANWRNGQLRQIQKRLHGGVVLEPSFLFKSQSNGQRLIDIFQTASNALDPRAQANLRGQINALLTSTSGQDFAKKVNRLIAEADAAYQAELNKRLSHKRSAWGKALHYASAPGEFLRTATVVDVYKAMDFFDGPGQTIDDDELWAYAKRSIEQANPIAKYTWEFLYDPLVYLRPFRMASTLVKGVRGVEALGGYVVRDSNSLFKLGSKTLDYQAGTWHLPIKGAAGSAIRSVPGVGAALTLKEKAIETSVNSVTQASRHIFRPVKQIEGLPTIKQHAIKAEVRQLAQDTGRKVTDNVQKAVPGLSKMLRDSKASIYIDKTRTQLSNIGASILGRYAEEIRVQTVTRVANQAARYAHDAALYGVDPEKFGLTWSDVVIGRDFFETRLAAGPRIISDGEAAEIRKKLAALSRYEAALTKAPRASSEEAIRLGQAEYDRIKAIAGVFIEGGGDPLARAKLVSRDGIAIEGDVLDLIDRRVHGILQQFEEVFLPRLQDHLEEFAEFGGLRLFDDAGRWAFHGGEEAAALRAVAKESFGIGKTVRIANPRHGIELDHGQMIRAVEGEIRRRSSRIVGYVARETMRGRTFPEDYLPRRIGQIRKNVEKSFDQLPNGKWVDRRETIKVSALYARNVEAALAAKRGIKTADELWSLAAPPILPDLAHDPFNNEVTALVWSMGGAHSDKLNNAMRDRTVRTLAKGRVEVGADGVIKRSPVDEFVDLLAGHHVALQRAYDHALPHELRRNWALMVALSKAQTAPFRFAYKMVNGFSSFWIFATLPLRPGWVVRNVADNAVKTFIAGVRDPRAYWRGGAYGNAAHSIFHAGVGPLRHSIHFLDGLFGTQAGRWFDQMLDTVWMHSTEDLGRLFEAHGITVPLDVLEKARFNPFEQKIAGGALRTHVNPDRISNPELKKAAQKYLDLDEAGRITRFRERVWEVMANTPEDYFKRVLYRDTYAKSVERGLTPIQAHDTAWAKVEETLFDYSKITVVEDNFRVFFPFIQFWRKNTGFWVKAFAQNPWLPYQLNKFEEMRDQAHADWPDWMRRYISTQEITDATAAVPGLGWIAEHALPENAQYDPLNFISFAPLYGIYKEKVLHGDNPNLPEDSKGSFFGGFLDALEDWGLGLNPFVRKPLESAGIASYRAWQTVFPETGFAEALTRKFFDDHFHVTDWEAVFSWGLKGLPSDQIAENFDKYVNMEMAGQAARGETVSRDRAENTMRAWFWEQNLYGFFTGAYFRKNTPEDYYLSKLHDSVINGQRSWDSLTESERRLEDLWRHRKLDRLAFDRYVEAYPLIQSYYKQGSWAEAQAFAQEHPEILRYVDPIFTKGQPYTRSYVKSAALYLKGKEFFDVRTLADRAGLDHNTTAAAYAAFATKDLQDFWHKNDTPKQERDRMIRGEWFKNMTELMDTYLAIPKNDYAAKDGFLKEHPDLELWWQMNNSAADDYRSIILGANADLRSRYFEIVKERGFEAAAPFLKEHPFMFEWTTAARKVDERTGTWISHSAKGKAYLAAKHGLDHYFELAAKDKDAAAKWLHSNDPDAKLARDYFAKYSKGSEAYQKAKPWLDYYSALKAKKGKNAAYAWLRGSSDGAKVVRDFFDKYGKKGKGSTQHSRDYVAAKPYLQRYFDIRDHQGKAAANHWLSQKGEAQRIVKDYFDKYADEGDKSAHALAYLRAKPWLERYFAMPEDVRDDWLRGGSKGAKIVQAYFDKYAHVNGTSAHAKAYLKVKPLLDRYFRMTKAQRKAWLKSDDPRAALVLDYFKRFSKTNRLEAAFRKNHPELASGDPELHQRLIFWKAYFSLPPDQRPGFVHANAEKYGVFAYSAVGEQEAHDREQKWIRQAMTVGKLTRAAATYLYVKPLLDEFYRLPKGEQRSLFLKANPELGDYFKQYANNGPQTGNKKLDASIEAYFKLPQDSAERSAFLRKHPEVQRYFDAHAAPAQRAMHNLLQTYFDLPLGQREAFREQHPEISAYFDSRREERHQQELQLSAFEHADPSLQPFFAQAEPDVARSAELMRANLRQGVINRLTPDTLERRRERQPL